MTLIRTVAEHLGKQRKQSDGQHPDGHGCCYRGDNGLMCAIGCLIPDELYDFQMEGKLFDDLYEFTKTFDHVVGLWKKEHPEHSTREAVRALMAIQEYHDNDYLLDYQNAKFEGLTDEQLTDQIETRLGSNVSDRLAQLHEEGKW